MVTYLDLVRELKKAENHKGEDHSYYSRCVWKGPRGMTSGSEDHRNNYDLPNYRTLKISKNPEQGHGDLRGFAVAQFSVKKHHLKSNVKKLYYNDNNYYYYYQ